MTAVISTCGRDRWRLLQVGTVTQLLEGKKLDYPAIAGANVTYRRAARAEAHLEELELGYEEPDPL